MEGVFLALIALTLLTHVALMNNSEILLVTNYSGLGCPFQNTSNKIL